VSRKPPYQTIEYEARLCPIRRPLEVLDRQHGRINELFAPFAFGNALLDPESIPVVINHHDKPIEAGHLARVTPGTDWLSGRFWLYDTLAGLYAAEKIDADGAVSVEFTPGRTLDRIGELEAAWHVDARLDAVAIITPPWRPAYPGAKVIALHDRAHELRKLSGARGPTSAAAPRTYVPDDTGKTLIRNFGKIIAIR
jgi:hypothetical protein